ncbi:hypothetical protein Bhyg_17254 [Pseudolycoriella hygida]|uniref:Protein kinase domain-containing protein n=1 Tax=Pseudolycoriella hygida TaxID=35572 RepID=A0A9Q0RTY2_9DIPT|nr:hypothetical protein Bhyg_17254 [Pseudolycoriella hygida]
MSLVFINKKFHRNGKTAAMNASAHNKKVIEQGKLLSEKNIMNGTVSDAPIKGSPSKYKRCKSIKVPCATQVQETPKNNEDSHQTSSLKTFLLSIRPNSKKKKKMLAKDAFLTHGENGASFLSDELNVSSNPSPNNVPNQIYEQSINKHGDVVDYAVPYSEDVIDENAFNKLLTGFSVETNELDVVIPERSKIKITDLDKSPDGTIPLYQSGIDINHTNNQEVLLELDSLQHWSKNIPQRRLSPQELTVDKNVHVIQCKPKEVKQKLSGFKNTIALPLHFSSGTFRKTSVTLRKGCPRDKTSVGLVEEAIERDYEILNQVKHKNIILLMAASFHRESCEHMTLVMEPLDFTLNYYLHHLDKTISLIDSIAVVHQIASAALYLQQCGFIHSNISSHNILIRENPWYVKLTSFELTTEVDFADTRVEILTTYQHLEKVDSHCAEVLNEVSTELQSISLREQYKQKSKLLPMLKCSPNTQHKCLRMKSEHVIYDSNYRQHLSLHNFQAPELLTTKHQFVFPTIKADVYSLCLVLWEMLNYCVPFVVYSKLDMERMIASNKMILPFFESERCSPFMSIFRLGMEINPANRNMDVEQLIKMLEDVKLRIRPGLTEENKEEHCELEGVNLYVNAAPKSQQNSISSLLCPDLTNLNQHLLCSPNKKRKMMPQKPINKNTLRQVINGSVQERNAQRDESLQPNENLRLQSLDEIAEECENIYATIVGPVVVKQNVLPSTMSTAKVERPSMSPKMDGRQDISENHSDCSQSGSNTFGTTNKMINLNETSCDFDIGVCSLPDTPIARKNKIRRNTWLSNKICDLVAENRERMTQCNKLNVSIRIVHNKVTPRKLDDERIKFFDSMESCGNDSSITLSKMEKVENSDKRSTANERIRNFVSKKITEPDRLNRTFSHFESRNDPSDLNKLSRIFENKLCKGESEISSRSSYSNETKVISPKWQSVRDKILKFEKRDESSESSSSFGVTSDLVRNLSKSLNSARSSGCKLSEVPTSIKRTVYKESIVSGVNLSSLDGKMPIFDQPKLSGQKLTTQVTLNMRQIRRRSSDLDEAERREIEGPREKSQNISISQKRLPRTSKEDGEKEHTCDACVMKISQDELKTSISGNPLSAKIDCQLISCQVPVNSQKTRSIEDLYIDDDFDQGLGANIELQSDCSDFLNFEISSQVFNKTNVDIDAKTINQRAFSL